MSDGYEYQMQLAERLSKTVGKASEPWEWVAAFFEVMRNEWDGLDKHRKDKFLYLTRVFLRKVLKRAVKVSST